MAGEATAHGCDARSSLDRASQFHRVSGEIETESLPSTTRLSLPFRRFGVRVRLAFT